MNTILQVCAFGAPNPGNFIASLLLLENKLKKEGFETIYAFADTAKDKEWCLRLKKNHQVYFLPVAKARILPSTYAVLKKIFKENDISLVHTHFELYDIPVAVVAPKNVKIFWHLHDPLPDHLSGLRGLLTRIQYGFMGKRAVLLSVSEYYRRQVIKIGFPKDQAVTILNGISLERIKPVTTDRKNRTYTFLTFCWDYYRKGTDLILSVCDRLYEEGYRFKILLNGNDQTWIHVKEYYREKIPTYVECGDSVRDVNILYDNTIAFIQASRRETFSYAVCEAAFAGLPVISSSIPGLEWAQGIPTVLFFKKEDIDGLYECMKKIVSETWIPDEQEVANSRAAIKNKFSLDIWCEKIIKMYKSYL